MAIPDYQSLMLPVLKIAGDGNEHHTRETIARLSDQFGLTEAERKQMLASGGLSVFDDRFGWARYYLKRAGLLQNPRRGYFQITDRGKTVLAQNPAKIDVKLLRQFPEFEAFYSPKKSAGDELFSEPEEEPTAETPEELLASGYLKLRKQLEFDVLARVKACPPDFFERLVVRLLTTMGYGGSLADAGKAIGQSGDGGIDGVIKEDKLGLDLLYIQAKRWDNASVGRPEIQKFVGALHGKRARKGIFLTTSTFTKEAKDYVEGLETKVILIDGAQLAGLMFDYGVGVSTANSYVVKRIDSDFFEDEGVAENSAATTSK
jgi:restriction system protein